MHIRGMALLGQRKYDEGDQMLRKALAMDAEVFGPSNSILESLGPVGRTLAKLTRDTELEKELREELALRTETLGAEHPETMHTLNNLSVVSDHQRKFTAAEDFKRQVIAISTKLLGPEHAETLHQSSQLAAILSSQQRHQEAMNIERDILAIQDRLLGRKHPDTLSTIATLGGYLINNGVFPEVLDICKRAFNGYMDTLGPDHKTTALWKFYWDAMIEVDEIGYHKTDGKIPYEEYIARKEGFSMVDTKTEKSVALVLRTKGREWLRPNLKRLKTGKETVQRWFAVDEKE